MKTELCFYSIQRNVKLFQLNIQLFRGCLYAKNVPVYILVNQVPRLAGMILMFVYMRSLAQVCMDENVTWYCFEFSSVWGHSKMTSPRQDWRGVSKIRDKKSHRGRGNRQIVTSPQKKIRLNFYFLLVFGQRSSR